MYIKDNNKTAYWVGHAKLKTLDADAFFKRKQVVDDVQAISTSTTFEQLDSGINRIHIYYKKMKNKNMNRQIMMLI